jgi:hypothetical protein
VPQPQTSSQSLLSRLEAHYRDHFPALVAGWGSSGGLKLKLRELLEWRGEIVSAQLEKGLALYQAEELADDVVFPQPGPEPKDAVPMEE